MLFDDPDIIFTNGMSLPTGTVVLLYTTPNSGYELVYLLKTINGTTTPLTPVGNRAEFTLTANVFINAYFRLIAATLPIATYTIELIGGGTITAGAINVELFDFVNDIVLNSGDAVALGTELAIWAGVQYGYAYEIYRAIIDIGGIETILDSIDDGFINYDITVTGDIKITIEVIPAFAVTYLFAMLDDPSATPSPDAAEFTIIRGMNQIFDGDMVGYGGIIEFEVIPNTALGYILAYILVNDVVNTTGYYTVIGDVEITVVLTQDLPIVTYTIELIGGDVITDGAVSVEIFNHEIGVALASGDAVPVGTEIALSVGIAPGYDYQIDHARIHIDGVDTFADPGGGGTYLIYNFDATADADILVVFRRTFAVTYSFAISGDPAAIPSADAATITITHGVDYIADGDMLPYGALIEFTAIPNMALGYSLAEILVNGIANTTGYHTIIDTIEITVVLTQDLPTVTYTVELIGGGDITAGAVSVEIYDFANDIRLDSGDAVALGAEIALVVSIDPGYDYQIYRAIIDIGGVEEIAIPNLDGTLLIFNFAATNDANIIVEIRPTFAVAYTLELVGGGAITAGAIRVELYDADNDIVLDSGDTVALGTELAIWAGVQYGYAYEIYRAIIVMGGVETIVEVADDGSRFLNYDIVVTDDINITIEIQPAFVVSYTFAMQGDPLTAPSANAAEFFITRGLDSIFDGDMVGYGGIIEFYVILNTALDYSVYQILVNGVVNTTGSHTVIGATEITVVLELKQPTVTFAVELLGGGVPSIALPTPVLTQFDSGDIVGSGDSLPVGTRLRLQVEPVWTQGYEIRHVLITIGANTYTISPVISAANRGYIDLDDIILSGDIGIAVVYGRMATISLDFEIAGGGAVPANPAVVAFVPVIDIGPTGPGDFVPHGMGFTFTANTPAAGHELFSATIEIAGEPPETIAATGGAISANIIATADIAITVTLRNQPSVSIGFALEGGGTPSVNLANIVNVTRNDGLVSVTDGDLVPLGADLDVSITNNPALGYEIVRALISIASIMPGSYFYPIAGAIATQIYADGDVGIIVTVRQITVPIDLNVAMYGGGTLSISPDVELVIYATNEPVANYVPINTRLRIEANAYWNAGYEIRHIEIDIDGASPRIVTPIISDNNHGHIIIDDIIVTAATAINVVYDRMPAIGVSFELYGGGSPSVGITADISLVPTHFGGAPIDIGSFAPGDYIPLGVVVDFVIDGVSGDYVIYTVDLYMAGDFFGSMPLLGVTITGDIDFIVIVHEPVTITYNVAIYGDPTDTPNPAAVSVTITPTPAAGTNILPFGTTVDLAVNSADIGYSIYHALITIGTTTHTINPAADGMTLTHTFSAYGDVSIQIYLNRDTPSYAATYTLVFLGSGAITDGAINVELFDADNLEVLDSGDTVALDTNLSIWAGVEYGYAYEIYRAIIVMGGTTTTVDVADDGSRFLNYGIVVTNDINITIEIQPAFVVSYTFAMQGDPLTAPSANAAELFITRGLDIVFDGDMVGYSGIIEFYAMVNPALDYSVYQILVNGVVNTTGSHTVVGATAITVVLELNQSTVTFAAELIGGGAITAGAVSVEVFNREIGVALTSGDAVPLGTEIGLSVGIDTDYPYEIYRARVYIGSAPVRIANRNPGGMSLIYNFDDTNYDVNIIVEVRRMPQITWNLLGYGMAVPLGLVYGVVYAQYGEPGVHPIDSGENVLFGYDILFDLQIGATHANYYGIYHLIINEAGQMERRLTRTPGVANLREIIPASGNVDVTIVIRERPAVAYSVGVYFDPAGAAVHHPNAANVSMYYGGISPQTPIGSRVCFGQNIYISVAPNAGYYIYEARIFSGGIWLRSVQPIANGTISHTLAANYTDILIEIIGRQITHTITFATERIGGGAITAGAISVEVFYQGSWVTSGSDVPYGATVGLSVGVDIAYPYEIHRARIYVGSAPVRIAEANPGGASLVDNNIDVYGDVNIVVEVRRVAVITFSTSHRGTPPSPPPALPPNLADVSVQNASAANASVTSGNTVTQGDLLYLFAEAVSGMSPPLEIYYALVTVGGVPSTVNPSSVGGGISHEFTVQGDTNIEVFTRLIPSIWYNRITPDGIPGYPYMTDATINITRNSVPVSWNERIPTGTELNILVEQTANPRFTLYEVRVLMDGTADPIITPAVDGVVDKDIIVTGDVRVYIVMMPARVTFRYAMIDAGADPPPPPPTAGAVEFVITYLDWWNNPQNVAYGGYVMLGELLNVEILADGYYHIMDVVIRVGGEIYTPTFRDTDGPQNSLYHIFAYGDVEITVYLRRMVTITTVLLSNDDTDIGGMPALVIILPTPGPGGLVNKDREITINVSNRAGHNVLYAELVWGDDLSSRHRFYPGGMNNVAAHVFYAQTDTTLYVRLAVPTNVQPDFGRLTNTIPRRIPQTTGHSILVEWELGGNSGTIDSQLLERNIPRGATVRVVVPPLAGYELLYVTVSQALVYYKTLLADEVAPGNNNTFIALSSFSLNAVFTPPYSSFLSVTEEMLDGSAVSSEAANNWRLQLQPVPSGTLGAIISPGMNVEEDARLRFAIAPHAGYEIYSIILRMGGVDTPITIADALVPSLTPANPAVGYIFYATGDFSFVIIHREQ